MTDEIVATPSGLEERPRAHIADGTTYIRHARLSWHNLRNWTRVPRRAEAQCGRTVDVDDERTDLPPQRTCESCLRVLASKQTRQEGEE